LQQAIAYVAELRLAHGVEGEEMSQDLEADVAFFKWALDVVTRPNTTASANSGRGWSLVNSDRLTELEAIAERHRALENDIKAQADASFDMAYQHGWVAGYEKGYADADEAAAANR
jgi:flagellar biosynthesis/type III secretory pathway protein FliH